MKNLFSFLLISIFCFCIGNAQELTKSHTVKKGETLYRLSKIYNVSVQDIIKSNPNSESVIYVGDVLTIPNASNKNLENNDIVPSNASTYFVKRGDTKYGLSKKFGVSINELERKNPHIKKGLQAGHTLNLKTATNEPANSESNQNTTYKSHLVLKGETLYGLSKRYQVTVQELKSANPQLGILKYDTSILIPNKTDIVETSNVTKPKADIVKEEVVTTEEVSQEPHVEDAVVEESPVALNEEANKIIVEEEKKETEVISETVIEPVYEDYTIQPKETLYSLSKKANMSVAELISLNPQLEKSVQKGAVIKMPKTTSNNSNKTVGETNNTVTFNDQYDNLQSTIDKNIPIKILIALPFTEDEYSEIEFSSKGFKTITDKNLKRNLEYYRGVKLAIDSIKKIGVTIKTDIIKIDPNTTESSSNNANSKNTSLKGYSAILAPFYGNDLDWLSSLAFYSNIPVITTYTASNNMNLTNIVEALPTIDNQKIKMLDYLKSKEGNIIVISDYERDVSRDFIVTNVPEASVIETKKNGNFSSRELSTLLDNTKTNFVIIDSEFNGVFLNTTNILLKELSNHKIQLAVLESSIIPSEENISSKRFKILKMLYPEIDFISDTIELKQYPKNFKSNYADDPSKHVLYGFDITFDTLLRLCQSTSYNEDLSNKKTAYSYLKFNYKKNTSGRYLNNIVVIREFESSSTSNTTK